MNNDLTAQPEKSTAGSSSLSKPNTPDTNATQRVYVGSDTQQPRPQRPSAPASQRPASQRPASGKKAKKRRISRRDKITIISIASATVVLIAVLAIVLSSLFPSEEDNGLILKGVFAAGVDLSGMTPEQAKVALEEATANTYTKLDMSITVLDTTVTLSPQDTGAKLDIESVVADAYNYGRTGSRAEREQAKNYALANCYNVPITSYLNLDAQYILDVINDLGTQFSSTLSQPTLEISGTRPQMGVSKPNTSVVHQTMLIYVGTAEYGLDTQKLYNKVMEYYNMNIFQVVGECTVVAPESIEEKLLEKYNELCVAPIDAQIDPVTYEITPEVYGYGFDLDAVKEQIASTPYGETIPIYLTYLEPALTEELLSNSYFKDTLGIASSNLGIDTSWNSNIMTAALKLNNVIIKSGDVFSFNDLLGELTAEGGYVPATTYIGKRPTTVVGGGLTQLASVLYHAVLQSELEIVEQHNHTYVTNFVAAGQDVYINPGEADFKFRNNLHDPIRLVVKCENGTIVVQIIGTDTRDYRIEIESTIVKTYIPGQLYNYMNPDNASGYQDGQVLLPAMIGYDVETYCNKYDKTTGQLLIKEPVHTSHYDPRDAIVVRLLDQMPDSTDPTEETDPSETTDPLGPFLPA